MSVLSRFTKSSTPATGALRLTPLIGQAFAVFGAVRALRKARGGSKLEGLDALLTAASVVTGVLIVLKAIREDDEYES